jgi:hypothetical protein
MVQRRRAACQHARESSPLGGATARSRLAGRRTPRGGRRRWQTQSLRPPTRQRTSLSFLFGSLVASGGRSETANRRRIKSSSGHAFAIVETESQLPRLRPANRPPSGRRALGRLCHTEGNHGALVGEMKRLSLPEASERVGCRATNVSIAAIGRVCEMSCRLCDVWFVPGRGHRQSHVSKAVSFCQGQAMS